MGIWVGAFGVATQAGYAIYGLAGALIIGGSTLISSLGTQKVASALPPPADAAPEAKPGKKTTSKAAKATPALPPPLPRCLHLLGLRNPRRPS